MPTCTKIVQSTLNAAVFDMNTNNSGPGSVSGAAGTPPQPGMAGLFGCVGLAHAVVAAVCLSDAQPDVGFDMAPDNQMLLQRIIGIAAIQSATVALALCQATRTGMQATAIGDVLSIALLGVGAHGIVSMSRADVMKTSTGAGWGLLAASTALPAARLLSSKAMRHRIWTGVKGFFGVDGAHHTHGAYIKQQPQPPATTATRWYQALTPTLLAVGAAYAIWPRDTLSGFGVHHPTPQAVQAWRDVGVSIAIAGPAITWSLQRKASSKALLTGMAKILNGGLMAVSLLHLAILGPMWYEGQGGKGWISASLGVWGVTGLATLVGVKESLEGVLADKLG